MYLRIVTYGFIFIVRVIILLIYFVGLSVKEVFYVPKSFIFRKNVCLLQNLRTNERVSHLYYSFFFSANVLIKLYAKKDCCLLWYELLDNCYDIVN